MDIVEFNASDTRSKRLLNDGISDLLKSKSLSTFAAGEFILNLLKTIVSRIFIEALFVKSPLASRILDLGKHEHTTIMVLP